MKIKRIVAGVLCALMAWQTCGVVSAENNQPNYIPSQTYAAEEFDICGTWSGIYTVISNKKTIDVVTKLNIASCDADGNIDGILTYTSDDGSFGEYYFVGKYSLKTKKIRFKGNTWINQSSKVSFPEFYGTIDTVSKRISGILDENDKQTFSFTQKQSGKTETNSYKIIRPVSVGNCFYSMPNGISHTNFYGGPVGIGGSSTPIDVSRAFFGENASEYFVTVPRDSYITLNFSKPVRFDSNSKLYMQTTGIVDERGDIYAITVSGKPEFIQTVYETTEFHTIPLKKIDEDVIGIKIVGKDLDGASPGFDIVDLYILASESETSAEINYATGFSLMRNNITYNLLEEKQYFTKGSNETATLIVNPYYNQGISYVTVNQNNKVILKNVGGTFVDICPGKLFEENASISVTLYGENDTPIETREIGLIINSQSSIITPSPKELINYLSKGWTGEYDGNHDNIIVRRKYKLLFETIEENGNCSGIANIYEKQDKPYQTSGSYRFNGKIDFTTKRITFQGHTWITETDYDNFELLEFDAYFSNDFKEINGIVDNNEKRTVNLSADQYIDTPAHWGKDSIDYVTDSGLIDPVTENEFKPDDPMTRRVLVTALAKLSGVKDDHIEWAKQIGLLQGYGNGNYGEDDPVNREQLAVFIERYLRLMDYNVNELKTVQRSTFADDSSISEWAKAYVYLMQEMGVMQGRTGNKFDPAVQPTRAEGATVLYRLEELLDGVEKCEHVFGESVPVTNTGKWRDNGNGTHTKSTEYTMTCTLCGKIKSAVVDDITGNHDYITETIKTYKYLDMDNHEETVVTKSVCQVCKAAGASPAPSVTAKPHTFGGDGKCTAEGCSFETDEIPPEIYYKELLNTPDNQNPLDNPIIFNAVKNKLYTYNKILGEVDNIIMTLQSSPPLYRDLFLYSFMDYDYKIWYEDSIYKEEENKNEGISYYTVSFNPMLDSKRYPFDPFKNNTITLRNNWNIKDFSIFFHETGHAIDFNAKLYTFSFFSATVDNPVLYETIEGDVYNRILTTIDEYDKEKGLNLKYSEKTEIVNLILGDKDHTNSKIAREICNILSKEINSKLGKARNSQMVSDVYGGMTNNKIYGGFGHSIGYWFDENHTPTKYQCLEAWAEFFAAQITNDYDAIKLNEEYFPFTCKYFPSLAEEMLTYYKELHQ